MSINNKMETSEERLDKITEDIKEMKELVKRTNILADVLIVRVKKLLEKQ